MRSKLHGSICRLLGCAMTAAGALVLSGGCGNTAPPPKPAARYSTLPPKTVPAFMEGTIFQRADILGTQPFPVSAYGLVASLRNTGDSSGTPTKVREYMINTMVKRGFGQKLQGYDEPYYQPEAILQNPAFAIVRVDGFIPPGCREGQTFDIMVSALPDTLTTSLARGILYETYLGPNGANPVNPTVVNPAAACSGPIFVNPAYSIQNTDKSQNANSLRFGVVMDGGRSKADWPLTLRLRQPSMSLSRSLDARINQRFQNVGDKQRVIGGGTAYCVAIAQDEGTVAMYVPKSFRGDWEHLVGVVTHLYIDGSPEFAVRKGKQLAAEAMKPDAPLLDISYCWEGLGEKALGTMQPLMTSEKPEVAYAAARAAAFIGDPSAVAVLIKIAGTRDHPFQVNAVEILGALPQTQQITHALRALLDSETALVRLEAYRILSREQDASVFTRVIDERFVLDIVKSSGPPLVYATRQGIPRVAIIGDHTAVNLPLTFIAMNSNLSITSGLADNLLHVFYRGPDVHQPTTILSHPDVAELIARLGGEPQDSKDHLNFSYGDILGILQAMSDAGKLSGALADGQQVSAAFVLQDVSGAQSEILKAPTITEAGKNDSEVLPDFDPKKQDRKPINGVENGSRPQ